MFAGLAHDLVSAPRCAFPGSGVGGENARKGPPSEAVGIRRTATKWRTPSDSEGLRAAAAGLEGRAAHTAPPGRTNQEIALAGRAATASAQRAACYWSIQDPSDEVALSRIVPCTRRREPDSPALLRGSGIGRLVDDEDEGLAACTAGLQVLGLRSRLCATVASESFPIWAVIVSRNHLMI